MLLFVRRSGVDPPLYVSNSLQLFQRLRMKPLDTMAYHHLPTGNQATERDGSILRGALEFSTTFMGCYVELLCRPRGIVLELGCGTAPILRACLGTGRMCMALDNDERVLKNYLLPLLEHQERVVGAGPSQVQQGDDILDPLAGESPYD